MLDRLRSIANKILESNIDNEYRNRIKIIIDVLKDDNCFFKMDIDIAFSILKDLNFSKEESILIYKELIDSKNF